ncbi:MAG: hypothetical protein HUJ68_13560 [Clostridia bacterium]|nr:hypothetical protein [Clostridia bacterium]
MLLPFGYRGYLFTKLFKKTIIESAGNLVFNEKMRMMEDLDFVIRYMTHVDKVLFVNKPLYIYRMRRESAIHVLPKIEAIKSMELILEELRPFDKRVIDMQRWTYYTDLLSYISAEKKSISPERQHLFRKISEARNYFLFNNKYSLKGYIKKIFQEIKLRLREKLYGI